MIASFRRQLCLPGLACLAFAQPVAVTWLRCWSHLPCTRTTKLHVSPARLRWMLLPSVTSRWCELFSPVESFEWSPALQFVQTPLNNHNFVIFSCTANPKTSVKRSICYLNVVALFGRIELATTEWWSFEDHPLTLSLRPPRYIDAFNRWRSPFFFWWLL